MAARLDPALTGGLEDTQLYLELGRVAPEGLEGLADLVAVVPVARARQVLDPWQRGERRRLLCSFLPFWWHCVLFSLTRPALKYDSWIGGRDPGR